VILPARLRSNFGDLALVSKHLDGCLAVWTPEAFDTKSAEMAALLDGSLEERQRARAWAEGSAEVDLDRQGRVAIPGHLRTFAQLAEGAQALILGAITHIEIWHPERWELHGGLGDASLLGPQPPTLSLVRPAPERPDPDDPTEGE
jgi:MraZ protein